MIEWKPVMLILLFWLEGAAHDADVRFGRFDTVEECRAAAGRFAEALPQATRWSASCRRVAELGPEAEIE